jgi:uncharacterized protein YaaQ
MKMLLAIVSYDDARTVIASLTHARFSITKLATTGGFLKAGNVTLLIGTDEERLEEALDIIRTHCSARKQVLSSSPSTVAPGVYPSMPVQIDAGGATVFVLNVERFEKL